MESTDSDKKQYPIFNKVWEIKKSLGEGNTSKVYLAQHVEDKRQVALKIFKEEYLDRDEKSIRQIEKEIEVLQGLKFDNIVNIVCYGSDGHVSKPNGREMGNIVFLMLEYVSGGLLFDMCQSLENMGEDAGRYFMTQMMATLRYMHGVGVVHRDIKLENILVDENLNFKLADFGFATFKNITHLQDYFGTKTYMAPEIKENKVYDGRQVDIFSLGVVLFVIVQGTFPFQEAKETDYYYNLLMNGEVDKYFEKTHAQDLSSDFKDLIVKIFSYDPSKRPTVREIYEHPWMKEKCNMKEQRSILQTNLISERMKSTECSSVNS